MMTNIKSYEQIAREAGACLFVNQGKYAYLLNDNDLDDPVMYITPEDAWRACCIENNLLEK